MDSDEVEFLLSKGFSKSKVTEMLRVSHQTFYNKRSTLGQEHFSDLSDNDLDLKVRSIKSTQVIFCPREYECSEKNSEQAFTVLIQQEQQRGVLL